MAGRRLSEMTWEEVREMDAGRTVAILPVGAVEAHGPHLPLCTDVIIAKAMAAAGAAKLREFGVDSLILPPLSYAAAPFARGFPGTLSVSAETVRDLVIEIARAAAAHGFRSFALANAHLDPAHLSSLHQAVDAIEEEGRIRVAFPDLTRRRAAVRLSEEFRSGACHAGRFEGSVVLRERPDLFRTEIASTLPPNPASLSVAIREGRGSFEEAGGPRAYFGRPAEADAAEGEETVTLLGLILAETVMERLDGDPIRNPPVSRGEKGR